MTKKERFLTAFRGEQPDHIPGTEAGIDPKIISAVNRLTGGPEETDGNFMKVFYHVINYLGLDAVNVQVSTGIRKISDTHVIDKFGREFVTTEHGAPLPSKARVSTMEDLEGFDMETLIEPEDFNMIRDTMKTFGPDMGYCLVIMDPYKEGWQSLGGMEKLMMAMMIEPELTAGIFRKTTDYLHKLIDIGFDLGVDGFIMPGDYAMETGLLFSPELYRKYLKPLHIELLDHVHGRGGLMAKHSDGDDWPLMDDWIEIGFDGFHPVQPQCMDIAEVKAYLKGKMSVWGNIDCRTLLVKGTADDVRQNVRKTIDIAGPGGGYIMTSSNSIHSNVKPENYIAMMETLRDYGAY